MEDKKALADKSLALGSTRRFKSEQMKTNAKVVPTLYWWLAKVERELPRLSQPLPELPIRRQAHTFDGKSTRQAFIGRGKTRTAGAELPNAIFKIHDCPTDVCFDVKSKQINSTFLRGPRCKQTRFVNRVFLRLLFQRIPSALNYDHKKQQQQQQKPAAQANLQKGEKDSRPFQKARRGRGGFGRSAAPRPWKSKLRVGSSLQPAAIKISTSNSATSAETAAKRRRRDRADG